MEHPPTHGARDERPDQDHTQEQPRHGRQPDEDVPLDGTPLEQASTALRDSFAEADARGEVITGDDARAVAALLAAHLGPGSEMTRFAEAGEADPLGLQAECRSLKGRAWQTPNVDVWVQRFEQYLAAQVAPEAQTAPATQTETETDAQPDNPQIEQGIREHGNAFRAYLQLPDINPNRDDLLQTFPECYIGTFVLMDDLLDKLTEIRACQAALNAVASSWGFDGLASLDRAKVEAVARATWDIVEIGGTFYVFMK